MERGEKNDELVSTRHRDFMAIDPDYVILSNHSSLTHFTRKRGAEAIRPYLSPMENNPNLLRWQSPYAKPTSNFIFEKVFPPNGDEGDIVIYQAKPYNPL